MASPATTPFEVHYEAHRQRVHGWALRYAGGNRGWAEDLTHDVFIRLFEHLPRLSAQEDLGGWLYRVTANLAISKLRKERSLLRRITQLVDRAPETDDAPDLRLELREDAKAALATLETLPPRERVVMTLKLMEGKSQQEIARALGMSEGYVSKLVTRAWARIHAAGWDAPDAQA